MSRWYRRSPYCRRCGVQGHRSNSPNCPNISPEQKAELKERAKIRACSYCGESGHNIATCTHKKVDMEAYYNECVSYRRELIEDLVRHGIGPGALVSVNEQGPAIIEKLMLDYIGPRYRHNTIAVLLDRDYPLSSTFTWPLPRENYTNNVKVLSPVGEDIVRACVPEGWYTDREYAKTTFNRNYKRE